MRTSGGRGAEGWMLGIPIAALLFAASQSAGGTETMLTMLESTVRHTFTAAVELVRGLF
ncbi:MAG: hypothetical protein M3545_07995 [Acidobacteriota bacterium]|nr:hypothetical protein [Acidobacteriota bacterium]